MHPRILTLIFSLVSPVLAFADAQTPPPAGPVESAFLGLQTELKDPRMPKSGIVVAYIWPLSAAKEMGFQLGDEIRTLNDVILTDPETFSREVRKSNVNAKLRFQVRRAGKDLKVEGRVGSREKTMKAYEDQLRKDGYGKPLPPLPGLLWWNESARKWLEKPDADPIAKGKYTVLMSFDSCPECKEKRYMKLNQMQTLLSKMPGGDQVAYAGIYYDERAGKTGKDSNVQSATELVTSAPPSVPVAITYYPGDKPTPTDRDTQFLIHNHGTVIVDPAGKVEYLQVRGVPEQEFGIAFQKILLQLNEKATAGKKPVDGKPSSP